MNNYLISTFKILMNYISNIYIYFIYNILIDVLVIYLMN